MRRTTFKRKVGENDSDNASVPVPAAIKADTSFDANFAGDKDTWRNTSGFITKLMARRYHDKANVRRSVHIQAPKPK
jgi:hypothetical protein